MKVFIKILKIILGIVLGLVFSFLTIVSLSAISPSKYEEFFFRSMSHLWLIALIVAAWVFLMLWLLLRKPSGKKIKTDGIELLPESISELIDAIIGAMKYRRSVRADVRQELTDHFTDAMADCRDEQQKQERIKELIEEFGDIDLLGKLLRRAKKRCRPLWRTMVARTFQLMGLCVVLLILYIGWFFTGKPQITTNYLEVMNQQVRPVADDSQNAWPYYKQAAEKFVKYEDGNEDEKFDFHPTSPSPFTRSEQDRQIIQQSIDDNRESLDLIRQGNQKTYCWQVYGLEEYAEDNEIMFMLMPHLSDYRNLTYLMCWQGLLDAKQGDFKKPFNDVLEAYTFGQHLRGQNTTLIEQLVAMSVEWTSTETLRMLLAEYGAQVDATVLDSTRQRLAGLIEHKNFTVDFDCEKLFMRDEAQRCFTQSRFGKSHLYLPRLKVLGALDAHHFDPTDGDEIRVWIKGGLHVLFTHPDKEQTIRDVERFYTEMDKLATLTPASVKEQVLDMKKFETDAMENNVFLSVLMPALTKVSMYSHRGRVDSEATLTILGVMQYQEEYGQLPESLDILAKKGFLREVPIDPFSNESLVYRKTDDGFILYSVGYNFTDDGGVPGVYKGTNQNSHARRWTENGDAIFWPVE